MHGAGEVVWVRLPRELRLDGVSIPVGVPLAAVEVSVKEMSGFRAPAVKILVQGRLFTLWEYEYERCGPPPVQIVSVARFRGINDEEE